MKFYQRSRYYVDELTSERRKERSVISFIVRFRHGNGIFGVELFLFAQQKIISKKLMTWLFCRLSSNWRFSKFLKVSLFAMLDSKMFLLVLKSHLLLSIYKIISGNAQLLRSDLYRISIPPAEIATEETIVGSEKKLLPRHLFTMASRFTPF